MEELSVSELQEKHTLKYILKRIRQLINQYQDLVVIRYHLKLEMKLRNILYMEEMQITVSILINIYYKTYFLTLFIYSAINDSET